MPSAGLHSLGRGASRRKFVARPRREFSDLQHLGRGRELAQRARGEPGRARDDASPSLGASGRKAVIVDYLLGPAGPWARC
jgi:hypothetical protein